MLSRSSLYLGPLIQVYQISSQINILQPQKFNSQGYFLTFLLLNANLQLILWRSIHGTTYMCGPLSNGSVLWKVHHYFISSLCSIKECWWSTAWPLEAIKCGPQKCLSYCRYNTCYFTVGVLYEQVHFKIMIKILLPQMNKPTWSLTVITECYICASHLICSRLKAISLLDLFMAVALCYDDWIVTCLILQEHRPVCLSTLIEMLVVTFGCTIKSNITFLFSPSVQAH